jgi:hypothetical protein
VLGPSDAAAVGRLAGRQIGMQYHDVVVGEILEMADAPLADVIERLAVATGEDVSRDGEVVRTTGWRLQQDDPWPIEAFEAWNGLWEGLAALHGTPPGTPLSGRRTGAGIEWRITDG